MRRLPLLLALFALAIVAAWLATRDGPPSAKPTVTDAVAAPRTGSVAHREPRGHAAESGEVPETEPTTSPPAPAKPTGRVFVHVVTWEDGTPIAGARLHTIYVDHDSTTDANGDARVDVPMDEKTPDKADTWVEARAPGRVEGSAHIDVPSGSEQSVTIRLSAGFAVDGFVHDAAGKPIAGAHVVASDHSGCITPYPEVAETEGDAQGRFRIDGLPLTSHVGFEITAPGHPRKGVGRRPHDTKPLDVTLDAAGTIRGVVRTPTGSPAQDARVLASAVPDRNESRVEDAETRTDESGGFVLDTLDLGWNWTLVARDSDFMDSELSAGIPMSAEHAEATCDLALRPVAHVEIELDFAVPHAPAVARLVFPLEPDRECPVPGRTTVVVTSAGTWRVEASVEGLCRGGATAELGPGETKTVTIRFDEGASIAGVVVDDLGAPVAGAVVKAVDVDQSARQAACGPDGRFVVKGLRPVEHELHVTAPGHGDGVALKVVAPRDDLRIVVARNGEVAAKLRLPDGATPPEKYAVHWNAYPICPDDEPAWQGGALVRSLPPGNYIVDIEVDGYVKWERRDVDVSSGARTDLGEIVLDPGLPLSGRVVDLDGHAVPQIDVFVDDELEKSDATGHFAWPHLAAGTHEVRVTLSPDFLDATVPVTLSKDTPPLVVTLHRGALLRVALRGNASDEVLVCVFPSDTAAGAEANDTCSLSQVAPDRHERRIPAGPTRVEVRKDDVVLATKNVDLREGEDVEFEIALPK